MKKTNLINQFTYLKSSLYFSAMLIILSFVMANKWNITVRILLIVFGIYLLVNFFVKLNKYSKLYVQHRNNEVIAKITKRVSSSHICTFHLEYNYEGVKVKNVLNLSKNSKWDRLLSSVKEIKVTVVPSKPKLYFIPAIIEDIN
ncbi:hypothetical protein RJG79_09025 [Mycoplasmatota bacterium WC44]